MRVHRNVLKKGVLAPNGDRYEVIVRPRGISEAEPGDREHDGMGTVFEWGVHLLLYRGQWAVEIRCTTPGPDGPSPLADGVSVLGGFTSRKDALSRARDAEWFIQRGRSEELLQMSLRSGAASGTSGGAR